MARRSWDLSPGASLDEAISWLKTRAPMSPDAVEKLRAGARRQGFWMASVQTKARALRIRQSLEDAMAHGMSFETWRKQHRSILRRIPRAHLQTTYRNWIQSTHNAAKVNYLMDPEVKKRRPYWRFDAVLDGNTTQVCQACDGTVLPAGHKWFLSHTPPLHHNCRSTILGLTKTAAKRDGIRKRAPSSKMTAPAEGFGRQVVEPWTPTTKGVPDGYKAPARPELPKPKPLKRKK